METIDPVAREELLRRRSSRNSVLAQPSMAVTYAAPGQPPARLPQGDVPPAGPMVRWLGERISPRHIAAQVHDSPEDTIEHYLGPDEFEREFAHARAWNVPVLEEKLLVADGERDLSAAVADLLHATLPGLAWRPDVKSRDFRIGLVLHTFVNAPPDDATGQAMALELYAVPCAVEELDGTPITLEAWRARLKARRVGMDMTTMLADPAPCFTERVYFRVECATWANRETIGDNVAWYG